MQAVEGQENPSFMWESFQESEHSVYAQMVGDTRLHGAAVALSLGLPNGLVMFRIGWISRAGYTGCTRFNMRSAFTQYVPPSRSASPERAMGTRLRQDLRRLPARTRPSLFGSD